MIAAEAAHARRLSRLERQGRVGILRNPNDPPRPPPRKTALMGRWLSLRSGRRPSVERIEGAAQKVIEQLGGEVGAPTPLAALRHDSDGQLAGIDIATLMASVDGLGTQKPIRTPYGAQIRPETPPAEPTEPAPRRKIVSPDPVIEAAPAIAVPLPPRVTRPPRRVPVLRMLGAGVFLAFLLLVVLPAALSL